MSVQAMAQQAYAQKTTPIRTARGTEYDVFVKVTRQLKMTARESDTGISALAEALHLNRRLWALLACDVAGDNNALPKELRARLFFLSEFVQNYSSRILTENAEITPLIDINTAVMRGLRDGEVEK